MKPAKFDYFAPAILSEALGLLESLGTEAKLLAGGQTLIPAMSMRVARPSAIVDLNGVGELAFIRETAEGLEIGAMTRQRDLETSSEAARRCPLFRAALPHVAHFQIRNRGTLGGSLSHNDPAAELPAVVAALDGIVTLARREHERQVRWDQFFCGMLTTALEPNEILVSIRVTSPPPGSGVGFAEISRRHGDFALAGAAAILHGANDRAVDFARLVLFGVAHGPVRSIAAEGILAGSSPGSATWHAAADAIIRDIEPADDVHASAIYRREVAHTLAQRALAQAWADTYATNI
jgi:carbon-monoxide dehydrogenase medium subunit